MYISADQTEALMYCKKKKKKKKKIVIMLCGACSIGRADTSGTNVM